MLQSGFQEGQTLQSKSFVKVPVHHNPETLLILLNIIHRHTRRVLWSVDLNILTEFAILVDDYNCYETVKIFLDIWIDKLERSLLKNYSKDLIRWICISQVFKKEVLFKEVTKIAQRQSKREIQTFMLPIAPCQASRLG